MSDAIDRAPADSHWILEEEFDDGSRRYRNSVTGDRIMLRLTEKGRALLDGRTQTGSAVTQIMDVGE